MFSAETVKKRWDNLRDYFVLSRVFSKNDGQLYTNFIEYSMIKILKIDFIYCYLYTLSFPFSLYCESKFCLHVPVSVTVPGLLWTSL